MCLTKNNNFSSDDKLPSNFIPYNYNLSNNNILYSLSNEYKENKIKYEKQKNEDIIPLNQVRLHKNYDKNDSYKIFNSNDTYLNLKESKLNNKLKNMCFVTQPVNIPKD